MLAQARHFLKAALPRSHSVLGVSFPDSEHTKSHYLDLIGDDIYIVRNSAAATITSSGVVRVGGAFLDLDSGPFSAFRRMPTFRRPTYYPRIVSLWTHDWSTYYHWLIDVAPKIASAILHFGPEADTLMFVYPRPLAQYEIDTIELLGLSPSRFINTRVSGAIRSSEIFTLPLRGGWDGLNISPRIFKLKQLLGVPCTSNRCLYISRSGRRSIGNEPQLYSMLEKYGFEMIPDVRRTISEQISLFASASHVISPHGAALSNILWASKDTKVLELAASEYAPDHYVRLAQTLSMDFDRLKFGTRGHHWTNAANDFEVEISSVRTLIEGAWRL